MSYKVVITDYEYATLSPEEEVLKNVNGNIELIKAQCRTEEDVIEVAKDAHALINQYAPITKKVIDSLENCLVISRYGVGVNTIDVKAATEKNIIVGNVTDYCIDEVSDHAFALLMACARKVVTLNHAVKQGKWDFNVGIPIFRLRGRTVGLIGLGRIPQSLVKKVQAFGMNVIAYDPFIPIEVAKQLDVELLELNEVCMRADFISVHVPLIKETEHMITDEQFNLMRKEAFIINTARGPIIDEAALIRALAEGKIAGAGLDVLEVEPINVNSPLLLMDNVILNPHVAWYSEESQLELKRKTAQNVVDVLNGYYPSYVFNREIKDKVNLKEKD